MVIQIVIVLLVKLFSFNQHPQEILEMWIEGKSSWNKWRLEVQQPSFTTIPIWNNGRIVSFQQLAFNVPVKNIVSTRYKAMTKHAHDALKESKFSSIIWKADASKLESSKSDTLLLVSDGVMLIGGVSKNHRLSGSIWRDKNGAHILEGSTSIDMRSFNIEPPKAVLGFIQVSSVVEVKWRFIIH